MGASGIVRLDGRSVHCTASQTGVGVGFSFWIRSTVDGYQPRPGDRVNFVIMGGNAWSVSLAQPAPFGLVANAARPLDGEDGGERMEVAGVTTGFGELQPHLGGQVPPETIGVSFAEDRKTVTILFDRLNLELSGSEGAFSDTRLATFRLPVSLDETATMHGYVADLRGFVTKTPGTRVFVWADLGGTSAGWEFPLGEEVQEQKFTRTVASSERRGSIADEPQRPPLSPYAVTLVLTVQRERPEDFVMVSLDSLDVNLMD